MSNEKLKYLTSEKLRKNLHIAFKRFRIPGEFEDFEADYRLHILEGRGKKQTVQQFAIDWLRGEYGRSGDKKPISQAIQIDDLNMEAPETKSDHDFEAMVKHLPVLDRIMLVLLIKYKFTQCEVADVLGMTKGRVCQKVPKVLGGLLPRDIN